MKRDVVELLALFICATGAGVTLASFVAPAPIAVKLIFIGLALFIGGGAIAAIAGQR